MSSTSSNPAPKTVGDVAILLSDAYVAFSEALDDAPPELAPLLQSAASLVRWTQDQLETQGLHDDAQALQKLTGQLNDPTGKLAQLKNVLQELQQAAEVAAAVVDSAASLLPLL